MGKPVAVSVRRIAQLVGAAVVTSSAVLLGAPAPAASADPCADVEVIFARGTGEAPGLGAVGQALVDSLRTQIGPRTLDAYAVNYGASSDFGNRMEFARGVLDGIKDAGGRVESTAANCPNTRIVLGGFSQGAVVAGFVTAAAIPPGIPPNLVPPPMPADIADHVAAVALFGKPSDRFMRDVGAPLIVIGPLYVPKTLDLCAAGDSVCSGGAAGDAQAPDPALYVPGMTNDAAGFAASHL
ncbi:MAG TPA: cutinase family protein [Mycobacterium sp.]|nr:cutinase family protein [Mycobacterium sp.]